MARDVYARELTQQLALLQIPDNLIEHCCFEKCEHSREISEYADGILIAIRNAGMKAASDVKNIKKIVPGWKAYVMPKKIEMNRAYHIFCQNGKPDRGPLRKALCAAKNRYHSAVNFVRRNEEKMREESLANFMLQRKSTAFWKIILKMKPQKKTILPSLCNQTDHNEIANSWGVYFSDLLGVSNDFGSKLTEIMNHINSHLRQKIEALNDEERSEVMKISVDEVNAVILLMNGKKASGDPLLSEEHLIFSPLLLRYHLANFFTLVLRHGVTPAKTMECTIVPIPKSVTADSFGSFRGITLSTPLSKVTELIIFQNCEKYFKHSPL